ncbi:MAG: DUF433 domain-containing protein [Chloroflexi bacterium]|nr:DUF433 domain-containing protein [Chloroflexota bacterium]
MASDRLMASMIQEHIEIVSGAAGPKPRIVGHRILVQDVVVWHEILGIAPVEIVHDHPTITLADVYAALAYYWNHRDDIERAIQEENVLIEQFHRGRTGASQEKLKRSNGENDRA